MGHAEELVRRRTKRTKINNAIIGTVAIAGIISIAAIAPKAVELLGKSQYVRQRLFQARKRVTELIRRGYLARDLEGRVRLTQKGEQFAALMYDGALAPSKPKRWDGKWRLLVFDIPERRRRTRAQIRQTLVTLGFVRLQDSVWVYPYDCEDYIVILKAEYRIGKDVLYIIADHVEYDRPLREHFGLPPETA